MKFNLPSADISKIFKTDLEANNFEKVLEQVDKEKISIFKDLDKLEELYLIENIAKFKDPGFRIYLLSHAFGNNRFNNFCYKIGENLVSKNAPDKEKQEFVNKIASFEWGDNDQTRAFVNVFELDEGIIPSQKIIESDLEIIEGRVHPYHSFFYYQSEIDAKAKIQLSYPAGRVIIQIPTGGGKTKIGMEIITDFFNENTDVTVVWLAETEELLNQALNEFKKIWKHRGSKSIFLNRVWSTHDLVSDISGSRLIIGGLSKFISFFKKNKKLKADMIIFDEAHHAAAEKYSEVMVALEMPGRTTALGLTATPARGSEDETRKLVELFNNNEPIRMDTHNPHLSPIGFLQNLGVLAKMRIGGERVVPNPVLEDVFSDQEMEKLKKMKDTDDYTEKIRMKIGQSRLRNVIILKKILELNKEGRHILYFGASVEQSQLMYRLLNHLDVKAGLILGDVTITPTEYRSDLISKFQDKKINILLNYNVLVAGFDAPAIDTIFIARPTKSVNALFQMIGRGMRGPKVKDGTEFCDVYNVQDKFLSQFQNFDRLYETYTDYFTKDDLPEDVDES